jgi:hypothetical protein
MLFFRSSPEPQDVMCVCYSALRAPDLLSLFLKLLDLLLGAGAALVSIRLDLVEQLAYI